MVISPLPSFARSNANRSNLNLVPKKDGLKLPPAKAAILTVVSGPAKGAVHNLRKPRVIWDVKARASFERPGNFRAIIASGSARQLRKT